MISMIKRLAILSLLWALPLAFVQQDGFGGFAGMFSQGISLGGEANAQEQSQKKRKRTRRVPAMREATYKSLSEAQLMIDPESIPREEGEPIPEAKGTPREAIAMLMKLRERKGLNSYELAQIWNTLAFAYFTLDDIPRTIHAYQQILSQGTISEALELNSLRALFQLYYAEEDYRKAIEYIDRWEEVKGTPDPAVTFIKATANYQLNDADEAFRLALEVEAIAKAQERKMKEQWWYLQVVLYNEREDTDNVLRVLELLVINYPKKQYWMHMAGIYSEKDWEDKALSAYYAAYIQGFFVKESEIVMLAQRLLSLEGAPNPYQAAQVLAKGFADEIVEESEKNLRLLATAYTLSQETDDAITAWRRATKYAEDGELDYRLAQALANEDRHKEAIASYKSALKKGDVKKPADVNFWLGISHLQLEEWDDAVAAFREAGELDEDMEEQTHNYIKYIAQERKRLELVAAMLAEVVE
ncbi:MAG: tetratricopeptide repeat protein [Pseudomonadales bacterium]